MIPSRGVRLQTNTHGKESSDKSQTSQFSNLNISTANEVFDCIEVEDRPFVAQLERSSNPSAKTRHRWLRGTRSASKGDKMQKSRRTKKEQCRPSTRLPQGEENTRKRKVKKVQLERRGKNCKTESPETSRVRHREEIRGSARLTTKLKRKAAQGGKRKRQSPLRDKASPLKSKPSRRERLHSEERHFPCDYKGCRMAFKKVCPTLTFLTMSVVT